MVERAWTIGVDLGGTFLKLALLNPAGEIVARDRLPTGGFEGHDAVLARMAEGIRRLAAQAPAGAVGGVGVGAPGIVDMANGVIDDLPNLPGRWSGVPVTAMLATATGLPVRLINDARAFVVAEHRLGAARGADTALCVTVGTGIGGGIVAHGRVLFGLGGAAGEIGHQIVQPGGIACTCGNRGCVEPLATGPAITAEAIRRCVQGFTTTLPEMVGGDLNQITPELVDRAAEAGDPVAIGTLRDAGYWLGLGLAGAIGTLAPEIVVLGGGVARPGGCYWRAAEQTARTHVHVCDIDRIRFVPAALGYDAGVIGAALWGQSEGSG
ncbi:MAG: ROK family protein [Thermomicrobiales bacterium]|nr:ROK family protein [Thermomicrobiales bacterium]